MSPIEFDLERTVQAPIDQVFARLVDIDGFNEWMPKKGTILTRTRQTSPGAPTVGTTYVDETTHGPLPGQIEELEPPHKVVYHWQDTSKAGKVRAEGWPAFFLEPAGEGATLVRHHARLIPYGAYRWVAPIFRRLAIRERTTTLDALRASFEPGGSKPGS